MVKGVAVKFWNYEETIPKLLRLLKFGDELKKHDRVVLKVDLNEDKTKGTQVEFVEQVLKFCVENKNPGSEIVVADGAEKDDTMELFDELGYGKLAEKYGIGLVDLNHTESKEIDDKQYLRFGSVYYPEVLLNSFVISMPLLRTDEEDKMTGALSNMVGAFPASHYRGFFSSGKSKIKKWPMKYRVHDVLQCKMPDFALVDASANKLILAGKPLEIDKQGAKILGMDWKEVGHLRLAHESFSVEEMKREREEKEDVN
jgi:uncharacterized protein (DUF362 family)